MPKAHLSLSSSDSYPESGLPIEYVPGRAAGNTQIAIEIQKIRVARIHRSASLLVGKAIIYHKFLLKIRTPNFSTSELRVGLIGARTRLSSRSVKHRLYALLRHST